MSNYEALSTARVFKARSSLAHTFSGGVRMRQEKKDMTFLCRLLFRLLFLINEFLFSD